MSKEGLSPSEHRILALTEIFGVFLLSQFAFSLKTRKEIGKRDHWTCQDCGVQFQDGFMVHASHYNHDRSREDYDHADSGRIQCVDCHETYHELYVGNAQEIGLTEAGNDRAIEILSATDRRRRK